jgi:hypothetical protein
MLKYFLKNDKSQEVKVGDKIHVSVPTSTPYGPTTCEIDVLVTQDSLRQLIRDNIVVALEDKPQPNPEDYKPFVRRLARKNDITFDNALKILDFLKEISMYAHNALLIELMAYVMNERQGKRKVSYKLYPDGVLSVVCAADVHFPFFYQLADAKKAQELLKPFTNGK